MPYGQEAPPTCYRHPGRETWVSCVRCGRHACPDCLRSAAVGQQCVDCVNDAGKTTRRPTTVFGGRPARTATVTWTLIGLNVLLFLIELARPNIANDWGLLGDATFSANGPLQGIAAGQWYRLITSAFLPPATGLGGLGFLDIAFNLWALYAVGPSLEQLLGRTRFLAVYLLSALGGGVAFFLIGPSNELALGASGAIFGLFAPGSWYHGGCSSTAADPGADRDQPGVQLHLPLHDRLAGSHRRADRRALVTAAFAYAPRKNRILVQGGAVVAVLAILIGITVLRSNHLTAEFSRAAGL